jgi:hypothetical protein
MEIVLIIKKLVTFEYDNKKYNSEKYKYVSTSLFKNVNKK